MRAACVRARVSLLSISMEIISDMNVFQRQQFRSSTSSFFHKHKAAEAGENADIEPQSDNLSKRAAKCGYGEIHELQSKNQSAAACLELQPISNGVKTQYGI